MKVYETADIRNVVLLGHGGAGKTSLTSAMLFASGVTDRLGAVDDGSATTDFDEEETTRKISLQTAVSSSSSGVRGGASSWPCSILPNGGFGNFAKSILPFDVSGKLSRNTNEEGTMTEGNRSSM